MRRRNFLQLTALSSFALGVGCKQEKPSQYAESMKPVVIATWNHGLAANAAAWKVLSSNGTALDAVETGVRVSEADPQVDSVGYGGLPDRDGRVTLDAAIMAHDSRCGAVAALEHIMHPISVARLVMEKTPHWMLVGEGALQFALEQGFKKENLLTPQAKAAWEQWLATKTYKPTINAENHDTIGMLALDTAGHVAGACTTSGLAYKMHGRVGDSPIIGAGLFVDGDVGAATATGLGEAIVRIAASHLIVELMRQGNTPEQACKLALERLIQKNPHYKEIQVGFIALNLQGQTGAYGLQKGFTYALHTPQGNQLVEAPHLLA
ncbi:MAG: N(4)-(beta-N-acetylglucosaminyl)-L-asparaginase [Cytophagales bacterium]|nr:N(4)-(beta-N-acetylglucosaminyl)-L-asparaginase [Bernardetiaceae bacterium]MDW8204194.1 N(4)-(beta-N-acetylglucosaminyl)-L-asparaginase [Cytophagales bacterium]